MLTGPTFIKHSLMQLWTTSNVSTRFWCTRTCPSTTEADQQSPPLRQAEDAFVCYYLACHSDSVRPHIEKVHLPSGASFSLRDAWLKHFGPAAHHFSPPTLHPTYVSERDRYSQTPALQRHCHGACLASRLVGIEPLRLNTKPLAASLIRRLPAEAAAIDSGERPYHPNLFG
jgi:hypothetical protein